MIRFSKSLNVPVITLFHKASSPASLRVYTLLKQASAIASEHATEDQASDHSHQTLARREEFELNITEDPPTSEQLKRILEYIGAQRASTIIKSAKNKADAMKKLKENAENFQKPVTVDWKNGKVVVGDDISEVLKMVEKKTNMSD
ncbi:thioredoxin-like protein [Halenospora varia]|nr:thioredoxin-like protein [Halenospora varia]